MAQTTMQSTDQLRPPFSADELQDFLKSGWFLSIPSRNSRQVLVGWGPLQFHSESPVRQSGEAALFAPDFRMRARHPWISTRSWELVDREQFASVIESVSVGVEKKLKWHEPPRRLFEKRFQTISERFSSGILDKAVPVVFSTSHSEMDAGLRLQILQKLARLPSHLIIYGFWGASAESLDPSLDPSLAARLQGEFHEPPQGDPHEQASSEQGMIGVTPELLFSLVDEVPGEISLETAALAATRAKPSDPAFNEQEALALFNDPKERTEHQFVIDDISSVLKTIAHVETGETRVLELPTLFHLRTSIRALLKKSLSVDAAARLLHPTPALGFAPRALGISEMDHWDDGAYRWRYGAPFGVDAILGPSSARGINADLSADTTPGASGERHLRREPVADPAARAVPEHQPQPEIHLQECVVAIRNIQWADGEIRLGSGCGVVRASQVDREWQELQLKRDSVKRILGV